MEQSDKYSELKLQLAAIGCDFKENEPMCNHTSFHIGGPADIFIMPDSEDSLIKALNICKELQIPITVVGSGTNMLVSDLGIEGAVISTQGLKGISVSENGKMTAGAGVKIMSLSKAAARAFAYRARVCVGNTGKRWRRRIYECRLLRQRNERYINLLSPYISERTHWRIY